MLVLVLLPMLVCDWLVPITDRRSRHRVYLPLHRDCSSMIDNLGHSCDGRDLGSILLPARIPLLRYTADRVLGS
jgi:hypothetical protein